MKIETIFLLTHLAYVISASTKKFHEHLSAAELREIFHVDSIEQVPDYDITSIRSRVRRSSTSHVRTVHLEAFGQKKILNLQPNEHLSRNVPIYFADGGYPTKGISLTPAPHTDDVGVPYQDESSLTAVVVSHHPDSGALLMDGTVGEELVIRPIPHTLHSYVPKTREEESSQNDLYEDEAFLDDGENLEDDLVFSDGLPLIHDDETVMESSIPAGVHKGTNGTGSQLPDGLLLLRRKRSLKSEGMHVIYKRKGAPVDSDFAYLEEDHASTGEKKRSKRDAPFVIYPEILVLVDYDGYLLHGQDNSKIKSYYVSFWNGADLRYKLLKSPKVKISIAGIIISRSRDAMPYLERNRVGRDAIDSASALTDMGKYLYQERRLPTYDVAVAITKFDMCRQTSTGGPCNRGTAGFAYVGGACVVNKRLQKVNSVAIVEDTGGFSGIIVAAHEVGHLLGAVHDGSPPPSYLGGPGARRCRWKDGYIMSDLRHTEKGFRWSSCSIEQFHHFLNGETATCLYNLPHEDESLPRILPGKLMSLDAQCRKDRGTSACFKDARVCAQLFCFDKSTGYCVSYRPAAEGSECGDGKICLNGKCAYDDDNAITDIDFHGGDNHLPVVESQKHSEFKDIILFKGYYDLNYNPELSFSPSTTRSVQRFIPPNDPRFFDNVTPDPNLNKSPRPRQPTFRPFPIRTTTTTTTTTTPRTTTKRPTTKRTTRRPTTQRTTTTRKTTTERSTTTTRRTTPRTTERTTERTTPRTTRAPRTTRKTTPRTTTQRPTRRTTPRSTTQRITRRTTPRTTTTRKPFTMRTTEKMILQTTERTTKPTFEITTSRPSNHRFNPDVKSIQQFSDKSDQDESLTRSDQKTNKSISSRKSSNTNNLQNKSVTSRTFTYYVNTFKSINRKNNDNNNHNKDTITAKRPSFTHTTKRPTTKRPSFTQTTPKSSFLDIAQESSTQSSKVTTPTVEITTSRRSTLWVDKWKNNLSRRNSPRTPVKTTTTPRPTTTTPKFSINRISRDEKTSKKLSVFGHDSNCDDILTTIAGGMSCKQFLQSYGYRYCDHRYIHKNCCRARSEVCNK